MLKLNKWAVVGALTFPMLGACRAPAKETSSGLMGNKGDSKSKDDDKKSVFNFAEFVKDSQYGEAISPYVKNGDIVFGDMQKIGVRTNVKVETSGKTALTPNGASNIVGRYFVNGAIYPDGVKFKNGTIVQADKLTTPKGEVFSYPFGSAQSDKEYSVIDVEAKAGLDFDGIEGHVRILGDTKYSFSKVAKVDQKFTRTFLSLSYPVIYMINAKAKLGGEIGLEAEFDHRADDAFGLIFTPVVSVSATAAAEANVLVVEAGLKGILTLIETKLTTSAHVAYNNIADFSYGDLSMDTGTIKALDGVVKIYATAGIMNLIPDPIKDLFPEVFRNILKGTLLDSWFKKWSIEWEHTVWDPKPFATVAIPSRGITFTSDLSDRSSQECTAIRNELYKATDIMENVKKSSSGTKADIAQTAQANLSKLSLSVGSTCGR